MWVFWVLALLPITICGIMLLFNKRVSYQEWLISTSVALLMAGMFQLISSVGMTDDVETWSGYATQAKQYSAWKEYYEKAIYRTEYYTEEESYYEMDSEGNSRRRTRTVTKSRQVFDHWEPTSRWHNARWTLFTTLKDFRIDEPKFAYMCKKFNDRSAVAGTRRTSEHNSRMIDGDPNDYVANNHTGWIEPVTTTIHFENRIKASPSLFSYSKVPTNVIVYTWPNNPDQFRSDRVLGTAAVNIDILKWDQMNAVLGASKKINLIIVGFGNKGMDMAGWQEASWIGGKKNDLVICYGGGSKPNLPLGLKCLVGRKRILLNKIYSQFYWNILSTTKLFLKLLKKLKPIISLKIGVNSIIFPLNRQFGHIGCISLLWC
jgi:hypothetical protein